MKRLLFLILILSHIIPLSAQQLTEEQIKQKVNQTASAMKTMQCDFVQTKHLKMLNNDFVSHGKMYYQQSNKLRWEYTSPYSYTFILNNDQVLLKNKQRNDLIDVKQNKLFREIVRIMMSSVVGNCLADDKNYKVSIATIGNEWVATLLPQRKDMKQMFQKLVLHFNAKKSVVNTVELYDKNGEKTIIELKNIRTNETITSNMFVIQ
jgi:outer membrane lipoprotein carrier protein